MKKILIILWIIIIVGLIVIFKHYLAPQTLNNYEIIETETISEAQKTDEDSKPDEEKQKEPEENDDKMRTHTQTLEKITPTKTYTQHLTDGNKLFNQRYYKAALEEYLASHKLNQSSITPMVKIAETYLKLNEGQLAEQYYKKAFEITPSNIEIQIGLVKSYLNQRAIEKAKDLIWSMDLAHDTVKYYKAIILILYNDTEGAKNLFKEIVTTIAPEKELAKSATKFLNKYETFSYFTDEPTIFLEALLAQALIENQEFQAAIPLLFDIINEQNNYKDAWILMGYAYLNINKFQEAIDALSQAQELDEKNAQTNFFLGLAYASNNEIEKAIIYLERAKAYGYQPLDLLELRLAELYTQKANFVEASKNYESLLQKNTSNLTVFSNIIWLYIDKLDKPQNALMHAKKVVEVFPNEAMSHNLLGWSYIANEQYANASSALKTAIQINPDFEGAYLNIGLLHEKQENYIMAKEYYKKAYALSGSTKISNLAAEKYNNLINLNKSFQINISQDNFPSPPPVLP